MNITTTRENETAVLAIAGEIDTRASADLEKMLADLFAQNQFHIALDFSRVGYISSAGLRVLLAAQQQAQTLNGAIQLFGLNDYVRKVLEMLGVNRSLRVSATRQNTLRGN